MTLRPLALVLAGAALLGLNQRASAQTCSGNPCSVTNAASVTVGTMLKLSLSSTSTTLTSPDTTSFNQGHQDDLSALTATVKSNRAWSLKISGGTATGRSEEHTSELQSRPHLVCRLLLEKKKKPDKFT